MRKTTLPLLRCAETKKCGGDLELITDAKAKPSESDNEEILFGLLRCKKCKTEFPILAGVAIVVPDVEGYLVHHVKGLSKFVSDANIPQKFRKTYLKAKSAIVEEYVEEDLESDRVNALYLMNHYLTVAGSKTGAKTEWWKPILGKTDPLTDELVRKYWDDNPFTRIVKWFDARKKVSVIELGCGVGGLFHHLGDRAESYLGVDSSFQSVLLARHFNLGTPYVGEIKIPEDLYNGDVSRKLDFLKPLDTKNKNVDFIVGVIDLLPLKNSSFDVSVSMNTIDMLDDPRVLPEIQHKVLKHAGLAIQCGPYIWHRQVAKRMRSQLPKEVKTSADAVQAIYQKAGFKIEDSVDHIPWIFFKHSRQIELYSVHAILASKV